MQDSNTGFFHSNIDIITKNNPNFREVLATTPNMQLVVMSIEPFDEIGSEIHPYVTQFIRVEQGTGIAVINHESYALFDGVAVIIPLNTQHNIINTTNQPLKIYTLYSPPNHPRNRFDIYKPNEEHCD